MFRHIKYFQQSEDNACSKENQIKTCNSFLEELFLQMLIESHEHKKDKKA
jgi:hypothetical protein